MITRFVTSREVTPRGNAIVAPELLMPSSERTEVESLSRPVFPPASPTDRVAVDGKFLRVGGHKFYPKGVTYGPFRPDPTGCTFPSRDRVRADFELLQQLHANCLRVYHVPPPWFLDMAAEAGLKVLVDCAWSKHTCFLDDATTRREARDVIRQVARILRGHPAVLAVTVANEIPPDIARWYGGVRVARFLDELAGIVKEEDPLRLVTFANFPPTEFIQPEAIDFYSFNVYLHDPRPFQNYLDRLQNVAGEKPLVLTEIGMDAQREGAQRQAEFLRGHIEIAFRAGLAGVFVFAFTDDWYTGGHQVEDWFFGLTDRHRQPRPSFAAVTEAYRQAPYFPLPRYPKVSVVVASYNGGRTLPACLDSLRHLNYPDYEVILVDDGSTDNTAQIARHYPEVRTIHQPNFGLSAARNTGIRAATGELVAFTDSDCVVDEDWLYYMVGDLLRTDAAAIGGHNFPPAEDNPIAGCVAVAPGGPAHVMLNDREAEHIPGCNMMFWKWALDEIEGFDPVFRAAGDDVDVCWRLLQRGYKITFSPAGFVWHYRRNTVSAYLKQQMGYGVAEALLRNKHPEYFNSLGGMRWKGRIYSASKITSFFGRNVIYHGVFGSGLFQTLYAAAPIGLVTFLTSLEWHVVVTLGSFLLTAIWFALWPLPVLSLLASLTVAAVAGARVKIPPRQLRWWSRPLVAGLYLLQPIVRGWPRYARRLVTSGPDIEQRRTVWEQARQLRGLGARHTLQYWSETGVERFAFLQTLLEQLERDQWQVRTDTGWDEFDLIIYGDRFSLVEVRTVSENHGGAKRLLRARLEARWTLLAKVLLPLVVAISVILFHATGDRLEATPILLAIPAVALYLHLRCRRTLRLGVVLLDRAAQTLGLTRVAANQAAKNPSVKGER